MSQTAEGAGEATEAAERWRKRCVSRTLLSCPENWREDLLRFVDAYAAAWAEARPGSLAGIHKGARDVDLLRELSSGQTDASRRLSECLLGPHGLMAHGAHMFIAAVIEGGAGMEAAVAERYVEELPSLRALYGPDFAEPQSQSAALAMIQALEIERQIRAPAARRASPLSL